MNDTLIIVGIACMVIGCVLGYWSIRRYDTPTSRHGPWVSLLAVLSLATVAAVGHAGGVDQVEQRLAGTESRVFAEIRERYDEIKEAKEGNGTFSGLAAAAGNP